MKTIWPGLAAGLIGGAAAHAIVPATPTQILCVHEALLTIEVTDARSHDLHKLGSPMVGVTGRIEQVVQPSVGEFKAGGTINASFHVVDGAPMRVGNKTIPMNEGGGGSLGWPVTKGRITTAAAKKELIGRHLILALEPAQKISSGFGAEADARYRAEMGEPYQAAVYLAPKEEWVLKAWATCPRFGHG